MWTAITGMKIGDKTRENKGSMTDAHVHHVKTKYMPPRPDWCSGSKTTYPMLGRAGVWLGRKGSVHDLRY